MSLFSTAAQNKPKRSTFINSYNRKFSFKSGKLIPALVKEVLPGDKFKLNAQAFVRQMPMVAPMMHEQNLNFSWFFVPSRLVYDDFETFITGGEDGLQTPAKPYLEFEELMSSAFFPGIKDLTELSSLPDYMGLPVTQFEASIHDNIAGGIKPYGMKIDAMPFRAYQLIYNEYFRDQNLQTEIPIKKTGGKVVYPEFNDLVKLRSVCWKKDYFTSALPFAQRGPEVTFSLGETADLKLYSVDGQIADENSYIASTKIRRQSPSVLEGTVSITNTSAGASDSSFLSQSGLGTQQNSGAVLDVTTNTKADLSSATATSINELRRLARLQEWFEAKARGGGRYIEQILSMFGVVPDGGKLQRPEYLGGGTMPFVIDSIAQSSSSDSQPTPLATLGGKGTSAGSLGIKTKEFREHGYLFCLVFARPKTAYQQGLPKMFSRFEAIDYYWPQFARLGEQEVKNQELFVDKDDMRYNELTFGYQSRYAEYKYTPDTIAGQLKTTLNYWHMGRIFDGSTEEYESLNRPSLNSQFVECHPTKRIYAITDPNEDELILEIQFNEKAKRMMPFHITPKL